MTRNKIREALVLIAFNGKRELAKIVEGGLITTNKEKNEK